MARRLRISPDMRFTFVLAAILPAVLSSAAMAQTAVEETVTSDDLCPVARSQLMDAQADLFCAAMSTRLDGDVAATIDRLDRALVAIDDRSPFNTLLLISKAQFLVSVDQAREAQKAFQEALEAHPNSPLVMMNGTIGLTYTPYHRQAADYLLQLTRTNAEFARAVPDWVMPELVNRLRASGDWAMAVSLMTAMTGAGYQSNDMWLRSEMALIALDGAIDRNDEAAARLALRDMEDMVILAYVASSARYRMVWDDVAWRDPHEREALVRRSLRYRIARAPDGLDSQAGLVTALLPYVGGERITATYEDAIVARLDGGGVASGNLSFWIAPLANARVLAGDTPGAERLYDRWLSVRGTFDDMSRLTIEANYARFLAGEGRFDEALQAIEPAIAELTAMESDNAALMPMELVRLRALNGLDRLRADDPALVSFRQGARGNFSMTITALLLSGRYDDARDLVVERLNTEGNYRAALESLQPSVAGYRSPVDQQEQAAKARLRADPVVLRALASRGEIVEVEPIRLDDLNLPPLPQID